MNDKLYSANLDIEILPCGLDGHGKIVSADIIVRGDRCPMSQWHTDDMEFVDWLIKFMKQTNY